MTVLEDNIYFCVILLKWSVKYLHKMGNQLVGVAPSQIYPVEYYLNDHHDLSFDASLGSTRFFKVARARSQEGLIVVKVFAIQDPSLPLAIHRDRLDYIRSQLASSVNCLPFQRVVLTDKAGLIMREYVKYSLYDRMSTRPFLTQLEKKWITFQILYALHQCHKLGICHGDIKLENIMLTSWTWVLLTDFASFKPTFLPEDNPADYSYFFDTSRRRLCYVAPERFVKTLGMENQYRLQGVDDKLGSGLLLNESPCKAGDLVPSMDIFSAGCALLELWNDGTPALDLSGLLAYRNVDDRPASMKPPRNCDERLSEILYSMTQRNPHARLSAEVYLDNARGKLFPEYFYSFLQSYMLIFSAQPILPPDEKICRIYQDIKNIIEIFTRPPEDKNYSNLMVDESTTRDTALNSNVSELINEGFRVTTITITDKVKDVTNVEGKLSPKKNLGPDNEGLIIITSLVTSCIRGLHHCTSKLFCLEILMFLCENSSAETILDRILPYIIYLTHDPLPRVRVTALDTLTRCLRTIDALPRSDANVFPEYVFPEIAPRATDSSVAVRVAYANNIALLAETALFFLDETQCSNLKESAKINYESELSTLHEMVRQTVSNLLTDSQALVRRALVENGITKLCVFFGKQKANDVILSHVVTFLNDKEESSLRGCFFDCIVGIAAYVGYHCAPILLPLLQQGLTDQSEFIIAKALRATTSLAELGLFQKPSLCEIITESVCYLAHPNIWIRHEICGLISCVTGLLNPIDVNCKILPLVWPHLRHKLTQIDKAELLLESLEEPIPRNIFDCIMRYRDINQLIETLRERRVARLKVTQGMVPQYSDMGQQLKNLFRRLLADGLTEHVETQVLAMSAHLIKIQRTGASGNNQFQNDAPGRLYLSSTTTPSKLISLDLGTVDTHNENQLASKSLYGNVTASHAKRTHKTSVSSVQNAAEIHSQMNSEWQHMFGDPADQSISRDSHHPYLSPVLPASSAGSLAGQGLSASTPLQQGSPGASSSEQPGGSAGQLSSLADHSLLQERSYVQYSLAPCRVELRNLTARMQQKYTKSLRSRDSSAESKESSLPPANWRPGNTLLAYLHEHRAAVNRLVNLSGTNPAANTRGFFGSCSNDGTVKLWDVTKMEGSSYVNKSKSMYNRGAGPVISLSPCENNQSFVAATQDGSIFVLRLDSGSSRMSLSQCRQLDVAEDGGVVELACPGTGFGASVVTYTTLYGSIVGWDLRAPGNAWKLQGDLKQGVYTCLHVSPAGWLAVGTSSGCVRVWDLRFALPITTISHPNSERVRRLLAHPTQASCVLVVGARDAAAWCCETRHRRLALWPVTANSQQPLSYNTPASQYISAGYAGVSDSTTFLITGGSDQRIRHWDLDNPEDSYILVGAPNDPLKSVPDAVRYKSRLIDGTSVIQEWCKLPANAQSPSSVEESTYKALDSRSYHHTAPITDVTMVQGNRCYLLSSSADGCINVWK